MAIIILTLITAIIHLALGIMDFTSAEPSGLAVPFILNGIGYLALLAALFMNVPYFRDNRTVAHWLLIAFASVTLIAFFVVNRSNLAGAFGPAAIIAKSAEVLL